MHSHNLWLVLVIIIIIIIIKSALEDRELEEKPFAFLRTLTLKFKKEP